MFSEVLAGARELLDAGKPLVVTVEVQRREEDIRLTAQRVELLDHAAAGAAAGLKIYLAEESAVENLAAVFKQHGARGRGRVSLVLDAGDREVEMELGQSYAISAAMRGAIKSIPGIADVQDL
jgi:DNA polymerase-3 subunit alpha